MTVGREILNIHFNKCKVDSKAYYFSLGERSTVFFVGLQTAKERYFSAFTIEKGLQASGQQNCKPAAQDFVTYVVK